ncbi:MULTISPECIES: cell division protein FtsB [Alteromonadaceae]|uniref:cell division protein FtsB n=1 Tax=Alteromonadaceae TaxID=72275 RepID=UPI001C0A1326|nr:MULTISPECIES: cell division protein FtsB [Aliiglaciecola]MBU2878773.1 cell division protein FtsB [Aliiglaciecola lipolytica]MDO6711329.1 cell division protein FtsB [Aliiglaciecola sp. 2_MG-2023]MDO6752222.1 cell division protein FtsB [Aliiglaciecola sp. 1_MG-2023]
MKWITLILVSLCLLLQYRLWFGKNSIPDYIEIKQLVEEQQARNADLIQRNNLLLADIHDLKIGVDAMEERARNELGLIKQGETFYRILPAQD